jgi:hypothetical protein
MFETPKTELPGLLPDSFDPKDIWVDELGGEATRIPENYLVTGLGFEAQGALPFCVAFSVTKIMEHKLDNKVSLSQPKLFYDAGGGINGSYFRACLNVAKDKGCVPYETAPMPEDFWTKREFYNLQAMYKTIPYKGDEPKVVGYVRVNGYDPDAIKRAIMEHGPVLIGVSAAGGWWKNYTTRYKKTDNHACLVAGWDDKGWIAFDSLQPRSGFDGYHNLDKTYTFSSAYAIVEVKGAKWRDKVYKKREKGYAHCLNHYGKPRDFIAEQEAAALLTKEFKKFDNNSVWEAAGKFWTVLINMAAYGDYSISYRRLGVWKPGDLINMIYAYRRTGKLIFDPNTIHGEEGYRLD